MLAYSSPHGWHKAIHNMPTIHVSNNMDTLNIEQIREAHEKGFRVIAITPNGVQMFKSRREYGKSKSQGACVVFIIRQRIGYSRN